jgi:hypothetical protein
MTNVGWECGKFSRQLSKVSLAECAGGNSGRHSELLTSKRLWVVVYGLLFAPIQKARVPCPNNAFSVDMP